MSTQSLNDEAAKKVFRQVEFYFSDSNLPTDKFLKQTINDSEDGMVNLALLCSFTRMRSHLNLGTVKPEDVPEDTVQAVACTLRKSTFLKISEDGKKVGRTTKLSEEVLEQLDSRTIAATPLEYDVKHEDVETFFGQFAKVNSVRLPRHVAHKKVFCGTALIEFSTEEDAENILKQNMVYAGVKLTLKPKKDYDVERASEEETAAERYHQVEGNPGINEEVQSNHEPNYTQGLIVAFTLKSNTSGGSSEQKDANDATEEGKDMVSEDVKGDDEKLEDVKGDDEKLEDVKGDDEKLEDAKGDEKLEDVEGDDEKLEDVKGDDEKLEDVKGDDEKLEDVKGDDEKLENVEEESGENPSEVTQKESAEKDGETGLDNAKNETENGVNGESLAKEVQDKNDIITWEDLKAIFGKYGLVKYVDFKMGDESGYIRFDEPTAAKKARTAAALTEEGGLIVKKCIATLDPVTGDAEKEYWSLISNQQHSHRDNKSGNRGRGGRHSRGGRHFNGKHSRSRDNNSASRPNKFQKV